MSAAPPPRVTVVGDVGLDVRCRLTAALAPGDDTPARITAHPGGAGGNTAAWLADLGVRVELIARVGDDEAGRTAATELGARGVGCRFVVDPQHPTCRVVVLLGPDGDRTMVSDRGANAALHPDDIRLTDPGPPATCTCPATCCWTRPPARPDGPRWPGPPRPAGAPRWTRRPRPA